MLPSLVIDITGQKFNMLTPIKYLGGSMWDCVCDCGSTVIARGQDIRNGRHKSCGCIQADEDLSGKRFTRLIAHTLIKEADKHGRLWAKWMCECDCGNKVKVLARSLKCGNTKSCGCLNKEKKTKHGQCHTPEYAAWRSMLQRCNNTRAKNYHRYGGRGITVCVEWHDFTIFIEDMGKRPSGKHSLDRIENNKGYDPDNCRWATRCEQNSNKCTNKFVELDGETKTITEWCNEFGQQVAVVRKRMKRGMSIREALKCH